MPDPTTIDRQTGKLAIMLSDLEECLEVAEEQIDKLTDECRLHSYIVRSHNAERTTWMVMDTGQAAREANNVTVAECASRVEARALAIHLNIASLLRHATGRPQKIPDLDLLHLETD